MRGPSIFACLPGLSTHFMLQNFEKSQSNFGVADEALLPPPPPSQEIVAAEVSKPKQFVTDAITLQGGLTLLNGRVNGASVMTVGNADLVPGKYEGGLKLWECTVDLVETLRREIQDGQLSFRGKRVLELGCGNGLPGILACIKGATSVDFQDFNAEVLRSLTIHNVNLNLEQARSRLAKVTSDGTTQSKGLSIAPDVHYYAGDWGDVHKVLSVVPSGSPQNGNAVNAFNFTFTESDLLATEQESDVGDVISRVSRNRAGRRMSGSRACERGNSDSAQEGGYDIILMSDTVYSMASLPKLYGLIKKCLRPPYGVLYMAGKKHYIGGGGTRQFKHMVEEDGVMGAHLVADFADGSSNVHEVWKFFFK